MDLLQFPALHKALVEIAYDNGMVNRHSPESAAIDEMFNRVTLKYAPGQIDAVDQELSLLTAEQLEGVCVGGCGSDGEREVSISALADEMLDWAFDGDLTTL